MPAPVAHLPSDPERDLARVLSENAAGGQRLALVYAVVASVAAPTVTLTIRGVSVAGVHYLGAAPVAGTTVACLAAGRDLLVIGTPSR